MNSFPKPIAEKNVTPGPRFTVPYVPPYPLEDDFYTLTREEWTGALPPHSVTLFLCFLIPIGANLKRQTCTKIWTNICRNYENEVTRVSM